MRLASMLPLLLGSTLAAGAPCPPPGGGASDTAIASNPNRPSASDPADVTQVGLMEVEYGWARTWPGAGLGADQLGGLFRFGLLCDLELRFGADGLLRVREEGGVRRGLGDTWTGFQYRFRRESPGAPSLAFSYLLKQPVASSSKELGSGRPDHALTLLASKDLGEFHADFNAGALLAGRPAGQGRDRSLQLALAVSRPLAGPLGITGEVWGASRLSAENPAFASTLWALSYGITPRLTVDAAVDIGLTSGAPRKRLLMGFTYALTRLYNGQP